MTVHSIGRRAGDNVEWDLRVNLAAFRAGDIPSIPIIEVLE